MLEVKTGLFEEDLIGSPQFYAQSLHGDTKPKVEEFAAIALVRVVVLD
ncbi:MAG: hypothetical protein V7K89_32035 [Nostoc sp.]